MCDRMQSFDPTMKVTLPGADSYCKSRAGAGGAEGALRRSRLAACGCEAR